MILAQYNLKDKNTNNHSLVSQPKITTCKPMNQSAKQSNIVSTMNFNAVHLQHSVFLALVKSCDSDVNSSLGVTSNEVMPTFCLLPFLSLTLLQRIYLKPAHTKFPTLCLLPFLLLILPQSIYLKPVHTKFPTFCLLSFLLLILPQSNGLKPAHTKFPLFRFLSFLLLTFPQSIGLNQLMPSFLPFAISYCSLNVFPILYICL